MNGKIYCLRDMRNNEIRYVGFTRSTIKTRFSQHKHEALKRNTLSHVYNWFRSCKKDGILPTIELLEENIPLDKWEEKENYWINKFDNLTNQKSGGNGVHHNTNGSGRISSIDSKKKAIIQVDSKGNFIKKWSSSVEAETYFNGKHTGNIFSSIDNGSKAFGFYWVKESKYIKGFIPERKLEKKVYLYCLYTNNLIKEYSSISELSKEIGCNNSNIIQAIKQNIVLKDFYYVKYNKDENNIFPKKRPIFLNNGVYYNNFNKLYKEGNFKLGLGSIKKIKNNFLVENITDEIINKIRSNNEHGVRQTLHLWK